MHPTLCGTLQPRVRQCLDSLAQGRQVLVVGRPGTGRRLLCEEVGRRSPGSQLQVLSATPDAAIRGWLGLAWSNLDDQSIWDAIVDPRRTWGERRSRLRAVVDRIDEKLVLEGAELAGGSVNNPWQENDRGLFSRIRDACGLLTATSYSSWAEEWCEETGAEVVNLNVASNDRAAPERPEGFSKPEWHELVARHPVELRCQWLARILTEQFQVPPRVVLSIVQIGQPAEEGLLHLILSRLTPRDGMLLETLALMSRGARTAQIDFDDCPRLEASGLIQRRGDRLLCDPDIAELLTRRLWRTPIESIDRFDLASQILAGEDLAAWNLNGGLDPTRFDLALTASASDRIDLLDRVGFPTASYLRWRATELSLAGKHQQAARLYRTVLDLPGERNDAYSIEYLAYNLRKAGEIDAHGAIEHYMRAARLRPAALLYRKRHVECLILANEREWERELRSLFDDYQEQENLFRFALPELVLAMVVTGKTEDARHWLDQIPEHHRSGPRYEQAIRQLQQTAVLDPLLSGIEGQVQRRQEGRVREVDDQVAHVEWSSPPDLAGTVGDLELAMFPSGLAPARGMHIALIRFRPPGQPGVLDTRLAVLSGQREH